MTDDQLRNRIVRGVSVLEEAGQEAHRFSPTGTPVRSDRRRQSRLVLGAALVLIFALGGGLAYLSLKADSDQSQSTATDEGGGDPSTDSDQPVDSTTSTPTTEAATGETTSTETTTTDQSPTTEPSTSALADLPLTWVVPEGQSVAQAVDLSSGQVVIERPIETDELISIDPSSDGGLVVVRAADGGGSVTYLDPTGQEIVSAFGYGGQASPDGRELAVASFAGLQVITVDGGASTPIDSNPAAGHNHIVWLDADHLVWTVNDEARDLERVLRFFRRVGGQWTEDQTVPLGQVDLGSTTFGYLGDDFVVSVCNTPTIPTECPEWDAYRLNGGELEPIDAAPWAGSIIAGSQDGQLLLWRPDGSAAVLSVDGETPIEGRFDAVGW